MVILICKLALKITATSGCLRSWWMLLAWALTSLGRFLMAFQYNKVKTVGGSWVRALKADRRSEVNAPSSMRPCAVPVWPVC